MVSFCHILRIDCNLIQICNSNSSLATKRPQAFMYFEIVLDYCITKIRISEFYGILEAVPAKPFRTEKKTGRWYSIYQKSYRIRQYLSISSAFSYMVYASQMIFLYF